MCPTTAYSLLFPYITTGASRQYSLFPRTSQCPECCPVINDARDGALTGLPAYACVKRIPSLAILSIFGVLMYNQKSPELPRLYPEKTPR